MARDESITESQMIAIAPTSGNCDNPPAKGECATAKTAAKFTAQSFDTYDVTSKAEQAAIISLMAFLRVMISSTIRIISPVLRDREVSIPTYPFSRYFYTLHIWEIHTNLG